jgi:hypothetical protein
MSVLVDKNTRVLVQGLGKTGQFHTDKAIAYGTQMVAAVHPSRAGAEFHFEGETDHSGVPGRDESYSVDLPVFATVKEAVAETGANASVVYVPPPFAADAIMEAAAAGLELVVAITEGIPIADMIKSEALPGGQTDSSGGAQLPGGHHSGGVQDRHHARLYPSEGEDRRRLPFGNADLRGGASAHSPRARSDHRHRNRAVTRSMAPTSSTV